MRALPQLQGLALVHAGPLARRSAPRPPLPASPHGARRGARHARRRVCVAAAGEEADVAVFRFTLARAPAPAAQRRPGTPRRVYSAELTRSITRQRQGIPGFDDALIPRVIGTVGGLLLAANHALGGTGGDGLTRTEALGLLLGALCFALPTIGERLEEARGGVRANAGPGNAKQVFLLDESLSPSTSQELAWATFALLTTTNASCAVLVRGGEVTCARGTLSAGALAGGLAGLATKLAPALAVLQSAGTPGAVQYFPDAPPFPGWADVFTARSALVLPLARSGDFLLVSAPTSRAFDAKARAVATSLADKLSAAFER